MLRRLLLVAREPADLAEQHVGKVLFEDVLVVLGDVVAWVGGRECQRETLSCGDRRLSFFSACEPRKLPQPLDGNIRQEGARFAGHGGTTIGQGKGNAVRDKETPLTGLQNLLAARLHLAQKVRAAGELPRRPEGLALVRAEQATLLDAAALLQRREVGVVRRMLPSLVQRAADRARQQRRVLLAVRREVLDGVRLARLQRAVFGVVLEVAVTVSAGEGWSARPRQRAGGG